MEPTDKRMREQVEEDRFREIAESSFPEGEYPTGVSYTGGLIFVMTNISVYERTSDGKLARLKVRAEEQK